MLLQVQNSKAMLAIVVITPAVHVDVSTWAGCVRPCNVIVVALGEYEECVKYRELSEDVQSFKSHLFIERAEMHFTCTYFLSKYKSLFAHFSCLNQNFKANKVIRGYTWYASMTLKAFY